MQYTMQYKMRKERDPMKKFLSVIIALALASAALTLSGCTGGSGTVTGDDTSASKTELVMATNAQFPPYEYYSNGQIVGIDAEIAALIAEELGMTLKIVDIEFDSIVAGVQTGKYDMGMAGMTVTEKRLKNVNFSDSYATGVQVIIVKEGSPIMSVDDLGAEGATYKIGVQAQTTGDIYACDDYGSDRVTSYSAGADAVAALVAGKVDCVIIDNEPAKSFVKANAGLKILDTEYAVEDYAICVAKEDTELLAKINAALTKLKASGKLDEIVKKYIPS